MQPQKSWKWPRDSHVDASPIWTLSRGGRQSVHSLPSHQSKSEEGRPGHGATSTRSQGSGSVTFKPGVFSRSLPLAPALSRKSIPVFLSKPHPPRISEQTKGAKKPSYAFLEAVAASTPEVASCPSHSRTPCSTPSIRFWPYPACGGQTLTYIIALLLFVGATSPALISGVGQPALRAALLKSTCCYTFSILAYWVGGETYYGQQKTYQEVLSNFFETATLLCLLVLNPGDRNYFSECFIYCIGGVLKMSNKNSVGSLIINDSYLLLVSLLINELGAKTRSLSHTTNPLFPSTEEETGALLWESI